MTKKKQQMAADEIRKMAKELRRIGLGNNTIALLVKEGQKPRRKQNEKLHN